MLNACYSFFFNDTATTEIYTLSLHDALPISWMIDRFGSTEVKAKYLPSMIGMERMGSYCLTEPSSGSDAAALKDRKSTRLNSSHVSISYAVFCLKKKNTR